LSKDKQVARTRTRQQNTRQQNKPLTRTQKSNGTRPASCPGGGGANGDGPPSARLVDFGLALQFTPPIARLRTNYQSEQRVGVYGYMAPEVFRCDPYGVGVDIFAFGVLLYRSLKVSLQTPQLVPCSEPP